MRPPLLFLHGIGADADIWREECAALAPALALPLPGYGDAPRLAEPSVAAYARAVRDRLAAAGPDRVVAVGHSLGGMVALELALLAPERVAALVLVAAPAAFGSRDGRFQRRFLEERLAPLAAGRTLAELAPEAVPALCGPAPDPEGVRRAVAAMARVPEAAYRDALAALAGFDRRDALPRLTQPVLVVAGPHDRRVPPRTLRRLAAALPRATLAVVEGAGHLVPFERPRAFRAVLRRFLAETFDGSI